MLEMFRKEEAFFPHMLKKEIYTVIAKDNIDVNAKSTIIKQHYHGISMTTMQFPSDVNPGVPQEMEIDLANQDHYAVNKLALPKDYITLSELPFEKNAVICTCLYNEY